MKTYEIKQSFGWQNGGQDAALAYLVPLGYPVSEMAMRGLSELGWRQFDLDTDGRRFSVDGDALATSHKPWIEPEHWVELKRILDERKVALTEHNSRLD